MLNVQDQSQLQRLIAAGNTVLEQVQNGQLFADPTASAVAYDRLEQAIAAVSGRLLHSVSPFQRYRCEILARTPMGGALRALVLNLHDGRPGTALCQLYKQADDHHARIALELQAENHRTKGFDRAFTDLVEEILAEVETLGEAA